MNFAIRPGNNTLKLAQLFCLVLVGCLSTGCRQINQLNQSFQRMGYPEKAFEGYRDFVWAQRAYNLRFGNCQMAHGDDFREGFLRGYCEMCEGGQGHTPVIPPEQYWAERYQSSQGKLAVESWFKGYPEGVRAAKQDGASRFRNVYLSKEMQAAIQMSREENNSILRAEDRQPTPAITASNEISLPVENNPDEIPQMVPVMSPENLESDMPLPSRRGFLRNRFSPPVVDPTKIAPLDF